MACIDSEMRKHGYNTMCISWGMMGSMWRDKDPLNQFATVTVFVRPSRYAKEFIDKRIFYLSLFKEKDKDKLMYLEHIRVEMKIEF